VIPTAAWLWLAGAAAVPGAEERVVVTAERVPRTAAEVPAAVSVLTREQIEALPAAALAELLSYMPGILLYSSAPSGTPSMTMARGFFGGGEAEYLQLRIDGVPAADAESGLADWRAVPAPEIERVEALRGPASALYGDTALGGVVAVFTRIPDTPGGRAAVEAGNGGFASGWAELSGRAGAWIVGGFLDAQGAEGWREHSASRRGSVDLRARTGDIQGEPGGWVLRLRGDLDEGESPGLLPLAVAREDPDESDPMFQFDESRTRRLALSASHGRARESRFWNATIYASGRDAERTRTLLVAPDFGLPTRRDLEAQSLGGIVEAGTDGSLAGRAAQAGAGVEVSAEGLDVAYRAVGAEGNPGDPMGRESGRRFRTGAWVAGGVDATSCLRLTGSMRFDGVWDSFETGESEETQWSPLLAAVWRLPARAGSDASVYVKVSRAFKAPTLEQLFDPLLLPDGSGGGFSISNPDLRPQRAGTIEAGASFSSTRGSARLALYHTDVEDEIDFDPATFRYGNIGSTRHRGLEASATLAVSRAVSAMASWDWSQVSSREGPYPDRQLKNVPEHVLRAGVAVALARGWSASAVGLLTEGRYLDDANTQELAEIRSLDFRVRKQWNALAAEMDLRNATDERWDEAGIQLGAGAEGGYVLPAPGVRFAGRLIWSF
jgi:outer membrane cobalamin receptor